MATKTSLDAERGQPILGKNGGSLLMRLNVRETYIQWVWSGASQLKNGRFRLGALAGNSVSTRRVHRPTAHPGQTPKPNLTNFNFNINLLIINIIL
jgi:hypothetical protein